MVDNKWVTDQPAIFKLETSPLLKWGASACFIIGATIVLSSTTSPFGVAFVVAAMVILVGLVLGALALFSSATFDDSGIQICNLRRPEIVASWDNVQKIQIVWIWASCRVTFTDGSQRRIWACTSPMTWQALSNAQHWLEKYDAPLRLKSRGFRHATFWRAKTELR